MDQAAWPGPVAGDLPYTRQPLAGRDELCAWLEDALVRGGRVVLYGPPGLGKTHLAVELAHRAAAGGHFPGGIYWLNMSQPVSVPYQIAAFRPAAAGEGLDPRLARVRAAWAGPHPTLLICDDLDDPAALAPWLPGPGAGGVLVTGRPAAWARPPWQPVLLPPLARAASRTLLLAPAGPAGGAEHAAAADICELLGDLPLALTLAGAYLARGSALSADRYLARLRTALRAVPPLPARSRPQPEPEMGLLAPLTLHYADLQATRPADALAFDLLERTAARAVAAAFALTYEHLATAGGPAATLLHAAAACAPLPIPPALLLRMAGPAGEPAAGAALQALIAYRLLAAGPGGRLSLHPLLAALARALPTSPHAGGTPRWAAVRRPAAAAPDPPAALERALRAELESFAPDADPPAGWPYRDHLLHASAALAARQDPGAVALLAGLGRVLYAEGDLTGAALALDRALAMRPLASDPLPAATRPALYTLGRVRQAQGDRAAARALLEAALAGAQDAAPPALIAATLDALAGVLWDLQDWPAVQRALEQLVAVQEAAQGPGHPAVADALSALALLHQSRGDLPAAQRLYERVLALYAGATPRDPAPLGRVLEALAVLYTAQGRPATARPLLEQALALYIEGAGAASLPARRCRNRLAAVLVALGDAGAAPLLEAGLAGGEAVPADAETATTCYLLGGLRQAGGDPAGARPLLERALRLREALRGPDHPDTAEVLAALGALRATEGDLAGARPLLERALRIREAALGLAHPDALASVDALAALHEARGDPAAAGRLLARALAGVEGTPGTPPAAVAARLLDLGTLYQRQGRLDEARPALARALALYTAGSGDDPLGTAGALQALGLLDRAQGDWPAARWRLAQALALLDATLGPAHPATGRQQALLIRLLRDADEPDLARALLAHSAARCAEVLGPDHPATRASRAQLAAWDGAEPAGT